MPRNYVAPRRRKSPLPAILTAAFLILVGGAIYLSTIDAEAPLQRIEQDVTNEALAN